MTFAARLVAYKPGGARLTDVLLDAVDWDVSLPLNDVSALSLSYPSVADAAPALMESPVEIAVEVSDGGAWVEPRNARLISSEIQADLARPLDVPRFTFRGLGALLERAFILRKADNPGKPYDSDDKRNFLSATAGQIVLTVVQESRAKYSKMLQGIDFGFTASTDSRGKAWNKLDSVAFEPGTDLLRILDDSVQRGIIDWWMDGRTLHVVNADSAAVTRDLRLQLTDVTESPLRATFEGMATRTALEGAEGKYWEKSIAGAVVPYGDRVIRSASDAISTEGTAQDLLDRTGLQASQPRREYTRAIAVIDYSPFIDWAVGDWVEMKTRDTWESVRVFEAGLSYKASDATISARVTLNDRFVDASVRDAKRLQGIVHGTTQNLGSGGIPSRADRAVPAAPKGLAANSIGYWLDAIPLSSVDVSWQAVTSDTNGLALNGVDYYEVSCGGQRKRSTTTSVGFDGLQPSRIHTVTVRAVSSTGIQGKTSSTEVLTAYPLAKLDPPTKPSLRTSVGAIQVSWDGKLQGAGDPYKPPLHFSHILVETRLISTAGQPWVRWSRDNGFVHTGLAAGDRYEVRLIAVDMLGKESDPSPVATITVESEVQDALDRADTVATEMIQAQKDILDTHNLAMGMQDEIDIAVTKALGAATEAGKAASLVTTLDGLITVAKRNPTAADGAGKKAGSVWQVKSGNTALDRTYVWAYDDSGTSEFARTRRVGGVLKVDDTATTAIPEFLVRDDGTLAYLTGADLDRANAGLKVAGGRVSTVTLGLAWRRLRATQDFIGANSIGRAQIIDLAVGTAQIADLAVTNAKIGELSVDKLFVQTGANIPVAVINHLFTQSATITNLRAQKVVIAGDATNQVSAIMLANGAVTTPKLFAQAVTAEKIAVGALDAFQITSPLIQSVSTARRGIKWNGNSFVAYNNSGSEMIRLEGNTGEITGVTITGGTVRTAVSGQRIQLVSSGDLYAYAPNGLETLRIQTADDDGGATYFRGPAVGSQRSYLRLGRGVVDGTDTAQTWLGFAGGDRPSRVWVHSYGAWYLGGERGRVELKNSTGELRLVAGSATNLMGIYNIPTTTSTGQPLTTILGGDLRSLYRNTSLAKYKLDVQDLSADDPYRVLRLQPRDWWDRTAMEQVADGFEAAHLRAQGLEVPGLLALREDMPIPHRVPGFVAEEVANAIPELATWDGDGNLSGVAYDRVAAYLLVAMKAMKQEIDELRGQLND